MNAKLNNRKIASSVSRCLIAAMFACGGATFLSSVRAETDSPRLKGASYGSAVSLIEFIEEGQGDIWKEMSLTGAEAKILIASPPAGSRLVLPPSSLAGRPATLSAVDAEGNSLKGMVVEIGNREYISDGDGRVSFTAPEGDVKARMKDASDAQDFHITVVPSPSGQDSTRPPAIAKAPRYPLAGDYMTIEGGPFYGRASDNAVRIGERSIRVLAASPTSLTVKTPEGWPTGDSGPLTVTTPQGTSPPLDITFIRIRMEADDTNLLRGQSAKARIIVEGTREKIRLRITNLTPNVIRLEGGDAVIARTSGGKDNDANIKFTGVTPGGFTINAEVIEEQSRRVRE